MDARQKEELTAYLKAAREYTKSDITFKEDQGVIKDFIDRFGDDVSWENIEELCTTRRIAKGSADKERRFLYRWKMYKEGSPVKYILENYARAGHGTRACEIMGCKERDRHGFCIKRYSYRSSCPTLKELDELKSAGLSPVKESGKEKEPAKVDWIFGMTCAYKGSHSAVFRCKY